MKIGGGIFAGSDVGVKERSQGQIELWPEQWKIWNCHLLRWKGQGRTWFWGGINNSSVVAKFGLLVGHLSRDVRFWS